MYRITGKALRQDETDISMDPDFRQDGTYGKMEREEMLLDPSMEGRMEQIRHSSNRSECYL
jgi:hypothetical protein